MQLPFLIISILFLLFAFIYDDHGGFRKTFDGFDRVFAARFRLIRFARAEDLLGSAQKAEEILAALAAGDREITFGNVRFMRFYAASGSRNGSVVDTAEQLFAVGCEEFEIIGAHLFILADDPFARISFTVFIRNGFRFFDRGHRLLCPCGGRLFCFLFRRGFGLRCFLFVFGNRGIRFGSAIRLSAEETGSRTKTVSSGVSSASSARALHRMCRAPSHPL